MTRNNSDTPLMQQHRQIKQKYPDAILLFRVGDFYETFGEDAIIASRVLGITLTKRNNGAAASSELAGFPHHALDAYLHKLVKAGYRVAVCDQLEDPKLAKGIVKRGVTEMVTPGIASHEKLLEQGSNNFLAAIHIGAERTGLSLVDFSTGEFYVAEGSPEYIENLLVTYKPSEIIFAKSEQRHFKERYGNSFYTYPLESWVFDKTYAIELLLKQFQTISLKGFGVEDMEEGLIAAGAILHYLKDTEHQQLSHLGNIRRIHRDDYLWMDRFTIRNLELIHSNLPDGHTLLKVLDHTSSPMGARLLKRWLSMPLKDMEKIRERLELCAYLIKDVDRRNVLVSHIQHLGDIERLGSKIALRKIQPREVAHLATCLRRLEAIRGLSADSANDFLVKLGLSIQACLTLAEKIEQQLTENPPATASKGGIFKEGIHNELDELRLIAKGGKEYLVRLQQKEAEATGISSLKISYNNVFGYYLEVTNVHKQKVPAGWIRKQTLANAERYVTPELKEYEEKITGSEDRILAIEAELYEKLVGEMMESVEALQVNSHTIATLDCICCFAANAIKYNYRPPELHAGLELELKESRHPVIERFLPPSESYIPNDILLDPGSQQIIILTGPNMSGKSALLRQAALITLMAHAGSFVPAEMARIPLTDKIFTRVGASDNLSGGESTFMVEMNETASILNNISQRSLILLDEIGRGTSTYDGISIAWSIAEYLHESEFRPKTLFATHYHELNELESRFPRIKNYHITSRETGHKIIFLRKMEPGGSTHSFGIHVAKLAGMPAILIEKANEMLQVLEATRNRAGEPSLRSTHKPPEIQLTLFDAHSQTFAAIRKVLEAVDINQLTPLEALIKLQEIKSMIG